ncbi:hypothetical protein Pyn_02262 [Prunus yedoensis var. nudiflora]|uniref:Uncharacterized protein n=1 Tax=Prunus yedoensis var. nudiflora TaxID=2094558 RepID=A0A314ULP9_PRUYE|nr:hypothetical protein Pyn_02262 [Prunus yedoensis var. nudiflora]
MERISYLLAILLHVYFYGKDLGYAGLWQVECRHKGLVKGIDAIWRINGLVKEGDAIWTSAQEGESPMGGEKF